MEDVIDSDKYTISDGEHTVYVKGRGEQIVVIDSSGNKVDDGNQKSTWNRIKNMILGLTKGYSFEDVNGLQENYSGGGGSMQIFYTSDGLDHVKVGEGILQYSVKPGVDESKF